jgi:hypothetical protein
MEFVKREGNKATVHGGVDDDEFDDVIRALLSDKSVLELKISRFGRMKLNEKGSKVFSECLKVNNWIQTLCFSDQVMENEGFKHLGDGIGINTSLTELSLQDTGIGDVGIENLSKGLKLNKSIKKLDLSNNKFNDGVVFLVEVLNYNCSITSLLTSLLISPPFQ